MRKFITLVFFIFSISTYAQKEANFWYFGQNAALDFNSGVPLPTGSAATNQLSTIEGCSTFSDADGNLLFYIGAPSPAATNLTIWNRNNEPMPFSDVNNGGQLLNGDASSSQSALTVPAPGQPNIYYVFTVGAFSSGNAGFWYYTVDMTADNGLGDIVSGPTPLNNCINLGSWTEKVTAVRGDECDTFWVISYVLGNFIAYKVDDNGVDINNPVVSNLGSSSFNIGVTGVGNLDPRGYLKVSPDGTKMVAAHMSSGTFYFDFDDQTGIVSNPRELQVEGRNAYGVEFSPSSRRLYVSTGNFTRPSQEFLYQFDVATNDINTINSSRFTVFNYSNTRGALQLGPDNRIYWTSDGSRFISVINNPEELGAAVGYEHQTVDVGAGRQATQGLPPFLSSLLLPIDIIDDQTGQVLNDQTTPFCTGENKTITVDNITGSNITYEWTFFNGAASIVLSTNETLLLSNLTNADSGVYSVVITLIDDCGINTTLSGEFTVEVYESATANNNVSEILFCDTDNDGLNDFDLPSLKNVEILNGQDPATFEVRYFLSEADALSGFNPLPVPYTNPTPFSDQTLWARVENINALDACFAVTSFRVAVTGFPNPITPTDFVVCDDDSVGTDTDGFVERFVLNTKDAEILGSLSDTQYIVSYHLTADDADNNANPIDKNTPYRNVVANTQPIFVRVENVDNEDCYDASVSFNLVVADLPVLENQVINIEECDFDGVLDGRANVNLTQVNDEVSLNATSFRYYPSLSDAENDLNEILDPDNFRNDNPFSATNFSYWVRALSDENCFRIARVDVLVSAVGGFQPANLIPIEECDDFLDIDGNDTANNDDTDGITSFDFSIYVADIRAEFPPNENIEISFYRTQLDADLKNNPIADITNYRNIGGLPLPEIIYVRADNLDQNACEGVFAYFELFVNPVPNEPDPNNISDLRECDNDEDGDFTNGIVRTFDLRNQRDIILDGRNPSDFNVTFHRSQDHANNGLDPIPNISEVANNIRDRETIYVRIENTNTGCYTAKTNFDLIVDPLPTVNDIVSIEVCDEDTNPLDALFDNIPIRSLTETTLLNGQDPTRFFVSYHTSQADAETGTAPLPDTIDNRVLTNNIVYVRILDTQTQCVNAFSQFEVIVNIGPELPASIQEYEECDDDSNGFFRDGIVSTIDLSTKIPEILSLLSNNSIYNVSFFETQQGAIDNDASVQIDANSEYTNITPYRQTVYVRVENTTTGCVNEDGLNFDIVIHDPPNFTVTTPQIYCLNTTELILEPENPSGSYDYSWLNNDTGDITNGETLSVRSAGTYTVTATASDGTNCTYSETITVNESNIATLESSFVTVYDESNNNGIDRTIFVEIDTINNNLGPGDYQFALLNTETRRRIPVAGYQDEPRFENLEGGVYQVIVNDKNGCTPDATLVISVIQFPKFFTPNGDNINETWSVRGLTSSFYPSSKVRIFNRFGKVVATLSVDGPGWDGTFNGRLMPSDDYWFSVQLTDANGNIRERKGNFSLIRSQR